MWYKNYIKRKYDWVRRNPILSSYIGFVKGIIFTLILCSLLSSCGSYRIQQRGPEITHVLAITKEGDTLKVPIQELQRDLTPDYYEGYRFHWNNSWWLYNDWYWNYWYQNPRWFYPRYQVQIPQNRVRVRTPKVPQRYIPRPNTPNRVESATPRGSNTPQVQPNRGRSNQTIRKPQYVRPSNTRTRTTPNVIQRPTRSNNTPRKNNGNQ